uniref:Cytochrome P450, family 46, subfamily A, polypeptide 1, tandem duplicate 4 n=1 Tax=Amphilophus citrinellus TaxID=61819 RepID=A0A3Q0RCG1_AMPCI
MAVFSVLLSLAAPALMLLLLLLIIAFLGYCLYIKYIHMKYDHIPGPPRDSFFFGQSPTLVKMMENGGNVHDKFLECCLVILAYITNTLQYLLFFGNGLVTARDHEQWYKQRRIMDPAFSSLYLRGLMGTFNERAEKLMDKLAEVAESKTEANMLHLVNCVTLDVLSKVAFGVDLDLLNNSSPFPKAIETCLRGMVYYVRDMFFEFNPKNRAFINEARKACRLLRTTGAQWIHERKNAIQNGDEVPKDILTQIIKSLGMLIKT